MREGSVVHEWGSFFDYLQGPIYKPDLETLMSLRSPLVGAAWRVPQRRAPAAVAPLAFTWHVLAHSIPKCFVSLHYLIGRPCIQPLLQSFEPIKLKHWQGPSGSLGDLVDTAVASLRKRLHPDHSTDREQHSLGFLGLWRRAHEPRCR